MDNSIENIENLDPDRLIAILRALLIKKLENENEEKCKVANNNVQ